MFCYCALSVLDNSLDLTSDRDEFGSYKLRPQIILTPIYLISTSIAGVSSGGVVIAGGEKKQKKKHASDREGKKMCV